MRWLFPLWRFLLILGSLSFGLIAADVVCHGLLVKLDHQLADWFYRIGSQDHWKPSVQFITDLGSKRFLTFVGVFNVVAVLLARQWRWGIVIAFGQYLVTSLSGWIKELFTRPRPPFLGWDDYSFPSGHAFGATTIYGCSIVILYGLSRPSIWRHAAMGLNITLIIAISMSRVFYGAHYLSDILAGIACGTAYTALLTRLHQTTK